jgi:hypothetical protein
MGHYVQRLAELKYLDGIQWQLRSAVEFYSEILKASVRSESGTITDFASIPRVLWWAYPPAKYGEEAVPHDELYRKQAVEGRKITRKEADLVFLEALQLRSMPEIRRKLFYYGVRAGGLWAWNKYKRQLK